MAILSHVPVGALNLETFGSVLAPEDYERLVHTVQRGREAFDGRVVWNVNSTAQGGGVAEMLVSLLAYARGAGIDARWVVIGGNEDFFVLTKRIHNFLHGSAGDGGGLDEDARRVFDEVTERNAAEFRELVKPEDVVIIHDPQPAGLIPAIRDIGCPTVWRCHVGLDQPHPLARRAWQFLIPYVRDADAYVFSRAAFAWEGLEKEVTIIPPSIDAFSPKNQELDRERVLSILTVAGLNEANGDSAAAAPTFTNLDGSPGRVDRPAQRWERRPLRSSDRVVVQISRWDALKDPIGVIRGFAKHIAPEVPDAHLVYAGPAVESVTDDPEGGQVLAQAIAEYEAMPEEIAERVHLVALPMDDVQENAAIVNALQRRADVVVQKSLAEGFELTVAEAMWKARPVVASRIGGIQDQIVHNETGILLDDPLDLAAYGAAVRSLLDNPVRAEAMGREAKESVRHRFLGTRTLIQAIELYDRHPFADAAIKVLEAAGALNVVPPGQNRTSRRQPAQPIRRNPHPLQLQDRRADVVATDEDRRQVPRTVSRDPWFGRAARLRTRAPMVAAGAVDRVCSDSLRACPDVPTGSRGAGGSRGPSSVALTDRIPFRMFSTPSVRLAGGMGAKALIHRQDRNIRKGSSSTVSNGVRIAGTATEGMPS
jgi:trehalose synthase